MHSCVHSKYWHDMKLQTCTKNPPLGTYCMIFSDFVLSILVTLTFAKLKYAFQPDFIIVYVMCLHWAHCFAV